MAEVQKPSVRRKNRKTEMEKLKDQLNKINSGSFCYICGKHKPVDQFYLDTDINVHNAKRDGGNTSRICKQCFRKIADKSINGGNPRPITKDSLKKALFYVNKPYLEDLYDASIAEMSDKTLIRGRGDVVASYMKNIQLPQYVGKTWLDSDMFRNVIVDDEEKPTQQEVIAHMGDAAYEDFSKNKDDVQRLLGYDPFETEDIQDQPFMYARLVGMLDSSEDMNEDMMRVSSAIQIVRGFLQQAKIDDAIAKLMGNISDIADNSATIKSLQDSKQKLTNMITTLAAESCLSLKNSRTKTKASVTWTGKTAKIRELNLRQGQVNGFDINTCRGFQQVQEIQDAAIFKQLALDESEWSDMVAEMRRDNCRLRKEKQSYAEINRILLKENLDLKDALKQGGVEVDKSLVNLKDIYSVFKDEENGMELTGEVQEDGGDGDESYNPSV